LEGPDYTGHSIDENPSSPSFLLEAKNGSPQSWIDEGDGARADERKVSAVTVASKWNDPGWQVRFSGGLVDLMRDALRQARPSETGGLII
jgi:hypothetical protein